MENAQTAGKAVKQKRDWRTGALWIAAAVLIMLVLMPVFDRIWRDRTETHTREECRLIADALLKQSVNDRKSMSEWMVQLRQANCSVNALAAWASIYGGAGEEEIRKLYEDVEEVPEGVAYLQGNDYHVLFGEFEREEFDAALKARDELDGKWEYSIRGSEDPKEQEGYLDGAAAVTVDGDTWYYSSILRLSDAVVISRIPADSLVVTNQFMDILALIDENLLKSDYDFMLVCLEDNSVVRTKGDLDIAEGDILDTGTDENGRLKIKDTWYVYGSAATENYRLYAMVPDSKIKSKGVMAPFIPASMFAVLFLMTVLYGWFLRTDILRGRVEQERRPDGSENLFGILLRQTRLMFYILTICMIGLLLLASAIFVIDNTRVWGYQILTDIEQFFVENDQNAELVTQSRKTNDVLLADKICSFVEESPDRAQPQALQGLSLAIDKEIFLLNGDGVVESASMAEYDLSSLSDPDSDLAPLISVLAGKADHKGTTTLMGDTMYRCWATRKKKSDGMLVLMDDITQSDSLTDFYADYEVPTGLLLFAVDVETGVVLSSLNDTYCGLKAESIGLTEDVCSDGFAGDIMLDGRRYFVQTKADKDRANLIAADLLYLGGLYLPVLLKTIAIGLLVVLVMFGLVYCCQRKTWRNLEAAEPVTGPAAVADMASGRRQDAGKKDAASGKKETKEQKAQRKEAREEAEKEEAEREENASFYREHDGKLRADRGAVGRWTNLSMPFRELSADEKFRWLIHLGLLVVFVVGVILYELNSIDGIMGSTIAYLMQRTWRTGINVYAISYAVLVIFTIYIVTMVVRRLIVLAGKNMGSRGETISRLLGSFIAYAAVIGATVYSLMFLGVNAMTILASAGIVGLGISIGAKDLVADILAGIAIVFEGEFRTGDIIEIGGFRGEVEEIGVRTTKVMAMGNVKVFRNSEISGVVNLTQRHSFARVRVAVSRAEPLEEVEKIFRRELPRIRKKLPQAVEDISMGVSDMSHFYVELSFSTKCREADRVRVEKTLIRELDLLMERENIGSWGLAKTPDGFVPPPVS